LPVITLGMVVAGSKNDCGPSRAEDDTATCQAYAQKLAVAGALSALAASALDATFLTWHTPTPPDRGLTLAPVIAWDGHHNASAALTGTF
jgi:hypothetical protein